MLEIKNISKSFEDLAVLKDVSLHVNPGELVCLLGSSGGGKTTLFHIIAGLLSPDSGQVFLEGQPIVNTPGQVSYMLQKDLLLPYRTVLDNAILPLLVAGVSKKEARAKARPLFPQFGLDGTQNKYPHQLSGGMRQRVALLRTYLFSGKVALLDEPFSALDALTKSAMHQWYLQVMDDISLSTLFVTHDIDEAIFLSDRIYLLGNQPGEIVGEITIESPRPRTQDFTLSQKFLDYKRQILALL